VILLQFVIEALPISIHTTKIRAIETMFNVSKKEDIILDFLNLGINGLRNATNKKEGKNIPIVVATTPGNPAICQPMKVAEDKTGPGVNCPTAIAPAKAIGSENEILQEFRDVRAKIKHYCQEFVNANLM
jgi:hypothetical protein